MYDILIVGGGPAGLSAAITAKARNKTAAVLESADKGSAVYKAEKIDNYLGFYGVTGEQLLGSFKSHANKMGVEFILEKVTQLLSMGSYFSVRAGNSNYETKTIILATGIKWGGKIKGEKEFLGKGLSYCATCDGMLYKGKTAVICGDTEETFSDAEFLSEICKNVILITNKDYVPKHENIEKISGKVKEISGGFKVEHVITDKEQIKCDGVFLIGDNIPADALIYGLATKDGAIETDKSMRTNIKGVFAAGDCAGKPFQISKAVGEGLTAALSAVAFLASDNV